MSETSFLTDQQLDRTILEMQAECFRIREEMLHMPIKDSTGLSVLSRIFDAYMGAFLGFVGEHRSLLPYGIEYGGASGMLSSSDPHVLYVSYRDVEREENYPIVQFAVVSLPNDETYPLKGTLTEEMMDEMTDHVLHLNDLYHHNLEERDLTDCLGARLFYLPYLVAIGACSVKGMLDLPYVGTNLPENEPNEEFIPYELSFDTDDSDPKNHKMVIRMGQHKDDAKEVLAIEAMFNLNVLDYMAAKERQLSESAPPNQSIH